MKTKAFIALFLGLVFVGCSAQNTQDFRFQVSLLGQESQDVMEIPAEIGDSVRIHYTIKNVDGQVLVNSQNEQKPLAFTIGFGQIGSQVEESVIGMLPGQKKTFTAPAGEIPHAAVSGDVDLEYEIRLLEVR